LLKILSAKNFEFKLSLFPPNRRIGAILDDLMKINAVSASALNGVSALSSHKLPFRGFVDPRDPFAGIRRGITGVYFGLARTVDPADGGTFSRFRDAADLARARARARVPSFQKRRASRNGARTRCRPTIPRQFTYGRRRGRVS